MSETRDSTHEPGAAASPPRADDVPADGGLAPEARPESARAGGVPLPAGVARLISPRVTAALVALMLGLGVAIGAAIGPAPSASFAGASRLVPLLPSLLGTSAQSHPAAPAAAAPSSEAAPAKRRRRKHRPQATAPAAAAAESTPASTQPEASAPATPTAPGTSPSPTSPGGTGKTITPVTHVWLIELSGTSFAEALAQPAAAPYIDTQAVPSGTLLGGWSGVAAGAFAADAALLASTPPQTVDTIVQPPCPEGAAGADPAVGARCPAAGTPGALTAADAFLQATLPAITAGALYREHGLVVVTFATVASAAATGLTTAPAGGGPGAATATLTSQPAAGALLVSPFATAGARPTSAFDPASPRQSIERLLRR